MSPAARRARLIVGGASLAIVAQAASLGLVALSGWFLAASAVAGLTVGSTFSYLAPSAGIRAFALTRIASGYASRLVLHAAALAGATRDRARLATSAGDEVRRRSGRAAQALLADVTLANERVIRVTAPMIVFTVGAAASVSVVAALAPAAAAALAVSAAAVGLVVASSPRRRRADDASALRQEVTAAVDAWPEMRSLGAVGVLRRRVADLAAAADRVLDDEQAVDRAAELRAGLVAALGLGLVLLVGSAERSLTVPSLALLALLSAGTLEAGAALGSAASARREIHAAARRLARPAEAAPLGSVPSDIRLPEILAALTPGRTVLVHGPSGSGKTTVLEGLAAALGDAAVLVDPDAHLFAGTVHANLELARPGIPVAGVERLLAAVELDDSGITATTVIADDGRALSGGERQRLLLARAVAAAPAVLLLDEPATGLPAGQAARLLDRISAALPGTALVVARHEAAPAVHRAFALAARSASSGAAPGGTHEADPVTVSSRATGAP